MASTGTSVDAARFDPDQTIYVDGPMPTVDKKSNTRMQSSDENTNYWVQEGDAFGIEPKEGETIKVVYSDGVAFSTLRAGCTESLGVSDPIKNNNTAYVSGTFYISTGCLGSKGATVALYTGLVMHNSSSTTASLGATTTIATAKTCKSSTQTGYYGISAWNAGGAAWSNSRTLACRT